MALPSRDVPRILGSLDPALMARIDDCLRDSLSLP